MSTFLKRHKTRMRVHAYEAPLSGNKILGEGVDILSMPDGHLSCPMCQHPFFECWVLLDCHRLEVGCFKCGWSTRLLFPFDVDLSFFGGQGKFLCAKHPTGEMCILKNTDVLCVGCPYCVSEVRINLKTKSNILIA